MTDWTVNNIPDQLGKVVIVTGGNSGIGYEAALALAAKKAQVILAVRSVEKGEAALSEIRHQYPSAVVEVMRLDLSDLSSVRQFAADFQQRFKTLAILINNAGVMALPYYKTADGFEMQFGTNHLGHFALTGLLLPMITATPGARVVTVSSYLHTGGKVEFDNLDGARAYKKWDAYSLSKLANLLFAYELQRRLTTAGLNTLSVGCHPGYAATNLQATGPKMAGSRWNEIISQISNRLFAQSAEMGALPTLYAAVSPEVNGCDYIGPMGWMGIRGAPGKVRSNDDSYNAALAARLWQESEKLTGVQYNFPTQRSAL